ncbi:MAG: tRNA uridine-5-carboxymethylaminomethyl(34) synthesis GTPase MnmE, partial [Methylotenera sp.]
DRGIAIFYPNPHSYTGEDVLELQGHGGTALMQILLARCIALGARQAEPGEFTRRAYLNDKMDLAQAEAVADVINAATVEAAKSAVRSLSGEFSQHINTLLLKLIDLRMYVEACLDFPEEEIDFITQGRVADKLDAIIDELAFVFAKAKQGSLLREGINVVLVGQPNVGKSSLMNQLAGEEVAIVTSIAGTTRDTIKNAIQINGVPLHVIDTAGLRETDDEVEKFGIARTWRAAETANIALLLVDAAHGITNTEKSILERLPQEIPKIWVHNKIDVTQEPAIIEEKDKATHVYISAKTGAGLDLLKTHLLKLAGYQNNAEGVFMARARHLSALAQVRGHLDVATSQLNSAELVAEELRLAQDALGTITGEFTPDDLLGEIFSRFCIGK